MSLFDAQKSRIVNLSPEDYLDLSASEMKKIRSVKIVPPKLGERGFGHLRVEFKSNHYQVSGNVRPRARTRSVIYRPHTA